VRSTLVQVRSHGMTEANGGQLPFESMSVLDSADPLHFR
jgi:hypothetical protein